MSHNTDPERAARRHPAALIAILAAVVVAALAAFWFLGSDPVEEGPVEEGGVSRNPEIQQEMPAPDPSAPAPDPASPAQ